MDAEVLRFYMRCFLLCQDNKLFWTHPCLSQIWWSRGNKTYSVKQLCDWTKFIVNNMSNPSLMRGLRFCLKRIQNDSEIEIILVLLSLLHSISGCTCTFFGILHGACLKPFRILIKQISCSQSCGLIMKISQGWLCFKVLNCLLMATPVFGVFMRRPSDNWFQGLKGILECGLWAN